MEGAGRVCQIHARRCTEQACQSHWHWEHQVKFTAIDSLPGCKHSPYFPPFTSIFSSLSYYNYKFPLSFSSLFSHEFPSHKTAPIYISSVFLPHIFTTFFAPTFAGLGCKPYIAMDIACYFLSILTLYFLLPTGSTKQYPLQVVVYFLFNQVEILSLPRQ